MKYSVIILTIGLLMSTSSCNDNGQKTDSQSLMEASKQELVTALAERDQLLALMKEISSGMDEIKQLEKIMSLNGANSSENNTPQTKMLTDFAAIKRTIRQRKAQLAELEQEIQQSSLYTAELQSNIDALHKMMDGQSKQIEILQAQLSAANRQIGSLNSTVDSLNNTVTMVNDMLDSTQTISDQLRNELNTCYYVVATKSALKDHKIIETGFLRKTQLMKSDFDHDFFTISDKRVLDSIALPSKKVTIYTNHPTDSYEIISHNNSKTIKITDQEQFWSLSNYLVVQLD